MKNQSILFEILSMLSNYYWEMWPSDAFNWGWLEQGRDPCEQQYRHVLHDLVCCQCL